MTSERRGWGHKVLGVVFALFSANALVQVAMAIGGGNTDPVVLTVLQTLVGASALAAAWGSWTLKRWAPAAALSYGAITATMLFLLPWLLNLEPEAQFGIWTGAVAVLGCGVLAAWWLRRRRRRITAARKAAVNDA